MVVTMVGMIVVVALMAVIMAMFVAVVVAMTMMIMAVVRVASSMVVAVVAVVMPGHGAMPIGPAFWIERRLNEGDPRAKTTHHVLNHVIAADAQFRPHNLGRQMAVAEMPGNANEVIGVPRPDLGQRLGARNHQDHAALAEIEPAIGDERHGFRKIEQKRRATHALHCHASAMTVFVIENDPIKDRALGKGAGA
jgi:hypothetical protein